MYWMALFLLTNILLEHAFCYTKNKENFFRMPMMNFASLKTLPPHQRNFFALSIAIILFVGGGLIWYILHESEKFGFDDNGAIRSERVSKALTPEEQTRKALMESKSFVGMIEQVTTPKDGNVKFLRVRTSIIDESRLSETDFSAGAHELPLREETVDVAVMSGTVFSAGMNLESIHSGMMVAVRTKESLSSDVQLTAQSVDVLGNAEPTPNPSPRAQEK